MRGEGERPVRRANRLEGYDYSRNGAYFITICSREKQKLFGRVVGGGVLDAPQTLLTPFGKIVAEQLAAMNGFYSGVEVGPAVIMPNHIHFILFVGQGDGASGTPPPTTGKAKAPANAVVPRFISTLKRYTNRRAGCNLWQRSYYDHIIRDEGDYLAIAGYIQNNPARWREDRFYAAEAAP